MKSDKSIIKTDALLELLCILIGEYIILQYPNDKYHILKIISEYVNLEDD